MTFLASLFAPVWRWLAAAGAVIAAIAAVYLKGRREGKAAMQAEQDRLRQQAIENKRKLENEIDALGPADVDRRIDRWLRK